MKIGGHVSTAGGYINGLHKTIEIGGNCMQIFASSPRIWSSLNVENQTIQQFINTKIELNIDPIYFHASYLINLADAGFIGQRSRQRILEEMQLAEKMNIQGTIIHLGSYKEVDKTLPVSESKYKILIENIAWVLENSTASSYFIIENAGNRKIGWNIDEIARIVNDLQDDRIRVCLDTCHLHAAGYDLSTKDKFTAFFEYFDKHIGIQKLEVFQINDSKDVLGSFRDRHENIGEGTIPNETFRLLTNEQITKYIPFILEVPGVEKKGPNKEQIEKFTSFIANNASA